MKKILCAMFLLLLISLTGCSNSVNSPNSNINYKQMYEELLKNQAPIIKDVAFKTMDGKAIEKNANWYMLDKQVKIIIIFEGDCQTVDLFVSPSGSESYKMQRLIEEVSTTQNVVEYVWNVPDDTQGHFNIIAYNGNAGRKSDYYNIVSKTKVN